jgi:hypothetical protein
MYLFFDIFHIALTSSRISDIVEINNKFFCGNAFDGYIPA